MMVISEKLHASEVLGTCESAALGLVRAPFPLRRADLAALREELLPQGPRSQLHSASCSAPAAQRQLHSWVRSASCTAGCRAGCRAGCTARPLRAGSFGALRDARARRLLRPKA